MEGEAPVSAGFSLRVPGRRPPFGAPRGSPAAGAHRGLPSARNKRRGEPFGLSGHRAPPGRGLIAWLLLFLYDSLFNARSVPANRASPMDYSSLRRPPDAPLTAGGNSTVPPSRTAAGAKGVYSAMPRASRVPASGLPVSASQPSS